jgi:hypothetical protein
MRAVRLSLLVLALVVGSLCLLLAQDIRSWRHTLSKDRLQYTAYPRERLELAAPTALPAGISTTLLSVGNDQKWLQGLQKFVGAYELTANLDALGPGDFTILNDSTSALTPLTQSRNAALASQAYDLIAVVLFREAYPGDGVNTSIISAAVLDLENSVQLDNGNELAKENLELALRVAFATHAAVQFPLGAGNHIGTKRQGGIGSPPGEGY